MLREGSELSVHRQALSSDTHTHTRAGARNHVWETAFGYVCKFDRDLADSGHLALAAEQTAWLHLCVSTHAYASRTCRRHSSEQEETMKKKIDVRNDLTAGNMYWAKDRAAFFSSTVSVSVTSCTEFVVRSLPGGERTERICHPPSPAKCSLPLWKSITLTQRKREIFNPRIWVLARKSTALIYRRVEPHLARLSTRSPFFKKSSILSANVWKCMKPIHLNIK